MNINTLMLESDHVLKNPQTFDGSQDLTKELGVIRHNATVESNWATDNVCIYTDASKHQEGVGCAWVAIERGLADTSRKRRLPDEYNIVEAELIGMLDALRKWSG